MENIMPAPNAPPHVPRLHPDARGIRHGVEVQAETLYEAAVLGLQILKTSDFTEPIGGAARIDIEVREPVTRHTLTRLQLERWLQGAVSNPAEKVRKDRLKALLR
jgi:hypothetical protein